MASPPIKVLHFGLGPIGAAVVRQVADRKGFRIVGAVDIDPTKEGRDLGDVASVGRRLRIKVSADAKKTIKLTRPDVVVLCTTSSLKRTLPQIEEILKRKVPIVSTTEELAYPSKANMKYARVDPCPGEEIPGGRARHRRQSGLRDGCTAHHAHRGLRERGCHSCRSRSGRARAPASLSAEDRSRG